MCGIFAVVTKNRVLDDAEQQHIDLVALRGPDISGRVEIDLENGFFIHMISFVLHLQGDKVTPQPLECSKGNVLQWNGEVFGGLEIEKNESDTTILAEKLANCDNDFGIIDVIRQISGPWSFVYFQKSSKKLWFGRDYIGRRSFLFQCQENEFKLTSVAKRLHHIETAWSQVPADGIYSLTITNDGRTKLKCHHWRSITQPKVRKTDALWTNDANYVNHLVLPVEISKCTLVDPPIAKFMRFKKTKFPNIDPKLSNSDVLSTLLKNSDFSHVVNQFLEVLRAAVRKRVSNIPKKSGSEASLGVLFSGGIDCTVLALLSDDFIPKEEPIILLNVAFETPKSKGLFNVPDRVTGRTALKELERLRPERKWKFIEINISIEELKTARKAIISNLTHPLVTVLDDSIGCALWFAARGKINEVRHDTKVVLSGLGADEQLGGYSRHRSAFENSGWEAFEEEIMMEIERLSTRNLGRDDRIIGYHGKEARFPYLDEEVVSFLNQAPLDFKSNFAFKRGLGEKILLRAVGFMLGLLETAVFPKRAIQFGSRIAKSECRKEKASDVCERLL